MKRLSLFLLLALVFTIPALAQNNTVLNVHVQKAVAIPGNVLGPGDYTFRLSEVGEGRSVVAISSADSKIVYGFVHVYTAQRDSVGESEVVTTGAGAGVDRIDSWYFPGQQHGFRFIYSKSDLSKLDQMAQKATPKGTASGF